MYKYFLRREVSDRFIGNSSAFFWLLFQPIATLAVYYLVFGMIFKARVPDLPSELFVVYLSAGLWPWMAFSESVLSAAQLIINKKDLIGKVKVDLKVLLVSHVLVSFALHFIGLIAVTIILILLGLVEINWMLLILPIPMLTLFFLTLTLSFIFSALQVFNRDIKNILYAVFPLWFFLTPIIYDDGLLPDNLHGFLSYNPIFWVIESTQSIMLSTNSVPWTSLGILSVMVFVLLYFSIRFFDKLSTVFDDYL